jgi:carboxylesterase
MTTIMPGAEPFYRRGDRTGVLLLHGFTGTPNEMRWLGNSLADDGRTVRGPRLAGHATSPADMRATRWPDWYASTRDAYRQLRAECDRVFAAGLSMGGMLALHLAVEEAVDGLVLMASPAHIRDWRIPILRPFQRWIPYWPAGSPSYTDAELGDGHLVYDRYPTACVLSLLELAGVVRADLPRASAPALLVFSRADKLADAAEGEWVRAHLGSRDKRLVLLEQSSHIVCADCERERVLAEVRQFLANHGA